MNCPVDGTPLAMSERAEIEIDYCPTCRGVWLDRGELDKIIERATPHEPVAEPTKGLDLHRDRHHGRRRKRSMLSELFEFGD